MTITANDSGSPYGAEIVLPAVKFTDADDDAHMDAGSTNPTEEAL